MPRGGARYHGVPGASYGGPHDGRGTAARPTMLCKNHLSNQAPRYQGARWAQATEGQLGWKAMVAGGDGPSVMKMLETSGLRVSYSSTHGMGGHPRNNFNATMPLPVISDRSERGPGSRQFSHRDPPLRPPQVPTVQIPRIATGSTHPYSTGKKHRVHTGQRSHSSQRLH